MTSLTLVTLCLMAECAFAQQEPGAGRDDLDVTMQIIVDPDAELPDEVIRRIPLPARKPDEQAVSAADGDAAKPDAAAQGQERAQEARELGREMSEHARERAQDAAEQREQARRAIVEDRRGSPSPGLPLDPPDRPAPPPRP